MSAAISALWENSAKKSTSNIRIESNSEKEKYGVQLAFSARHIFFIFLISLTLVKNCRKNNVVIIWSSSGHWHFYPPHPTFKLSAYFPL
jgi:hypothetical protein